MPRKGQTLSPEAIERMKKSKIQRMLSKYNWEVAKDFECGIGITGLSDLREGDVIEAFVVEEKAKVV